MAVVDFSLYTNAACRVVDPVAEMSGVNTFSGAGSQVSDDWKLPVPCDIYVIARASNGSVQIEAVKHSGTASFTSPDLDITVADTATEASVEKVTLTTDKLYFAFKETATAAADLDIFQLLAIAKFPEGRGYHTANTAWNAFLEAGGSADWAQS